MRLAIVAILAVWASAAGNAAASELKSLTDRSDILGWEAVGRVELESGGYCTGVLIAPDTVLTAAHCIFDDESGVGVDVKELRFRAGLRDGEVIAASNVQEAVVHPSYKAAAEDEFLALRHDVALLRLASPIPATTASPFRVAAPPRTGHRVTVLSYGKGRSNAASRESGCSLLAQADGLIAFGCQGDPGSSGAPVFDTTGRSPVIVSMISAGTVYNGLPAVLGMSLPPVIADLRRAFETGEGVWPKQLPKSKRLDQSSQRNIGGALFLKP